MKRIPELRDLSDDHHTGLVLAQRCKRSTRPGSSVTPEVVWDEVREAFASHLEPHFLIEDRHLLPALEELGEAELAGRIREDHRVLRAMCASRDVSRASVERFGERLEAHIRFEERQVFETTQHRLPAKALEAIAAACETRPRSCAVPAR